MNSSNTDTRKLTDYELSREAKALVEAPYVCDIEDWYKAVVIIKREDARRLLALIEELERRALLKI